MPRSLIALLILVSATTVSAESRRRVAISDYCKPAVSPATVAMPAAGGHASVAVTMFGRGGSGGCVLGWPSENADWIVATASGSATLTLELDVAPNPTDTPRTALVHVRSAVVVVTQAGAPSNLLINGSFTSNLAGWSDTYSTGGGSALWAENTPSILTTPPVNIGIAAITSTQKGAGYQLNQCVAVTPGVTYDLGTDVFIPMGQSAGSVIFGFATYDDATCPPTSSATGLRTLNTASPLGQWFPMTTSFTADQRTHGLLLIIAAGQSPAPPYMAYFNDVYVRARK